MLGTENIEMIVPSLCSQGGQTASPLADPSRTQHHSTDKEESITPSIQST